MPDRCTEDVTTHVFESSFTGTVLICQYTKGEAQFQSDNISALQIIKETISRGATSKQTMVKIQSDIKESRIRVYVRVRSRGEIH